MLLRTPDHARSSTYRTGAALLLFATAVILTALAYEHIGGYLPCPLCLQQRYAYYAGIPLLFGALVAFAGDYPKLSALIFVLVAAAFLANAALGVYHAGAEWKFWPGPDTCAAGPGRLNLNAKDFLNPNANLNVVRCDEPAWRKFGISFAGYNVLISAALAFGSLVAAGQAWRRA